MTDWQKMQTAPRGNAPGPDRPLTFLDVLLVCAVASAIILIVFLLLKAMANRGGFDFPVSAALVVLLLLEPIAIFTGIYSILILRRRFAWADFGVRPAALIWIAPAILAALGCLAFAGAVSEVLDRFYKTSMLDEYLSVLAPDGLTLQREILLILIVGGLVPFAEELLFRGVIYGWLRQRRGVVFSVVVSALLFALAHTNVHMALQIFVTGIVLAVLYERSRSVLVSTLAHMTVNTISLLIIFTYAGGPATT